MFTGIIEEVGKIVKISHRGKLEIIEIVAENVCKDVDVGDSIAVNGVCLTLTQKRESRLIFDVMHETLSRTNLKSLRMGNSINLERPMRPDAYISGHFVYGHIDCVGKIAAFKRGVDEAYVDISIRREDQKYIVEKGSIAIDGISLTIGAIFSDRIRIFLIPHTLKNTVLRNKRIGDYVNVEFDMLAKYVYKQNRKNDITKEFLKETGFDV